MVEVIVLIFSKEIQEKWHGRFSTEGNTIRVLKPMSPKNVPRELRSSKGPLLELHFKISWPRGIKNQRFARLKENKPFGKPHYYLDHFLKHFLGDFILSLWYFVSWVLKVTLSWNLSQTYSSSKVWSQCSSTTFYNFWDIYFPVSVKKNSSRKPC